MKGSRVAYLKIFIFLFNSFSLQTGTIKHRRDWLFIQTTCQKTVWLGGKLWIIVRRQLSRGLLLLNLLNWIEFSRNIDGPGELLLRKGTILRESANERLANNQFRTGELLYWLVIKLYIYNIWYYYRYYVECSKSITIWGSEISHAKILSSKKNNNVALYIKH